MVEQNLWNKILGKFILKAYIESCENSVQLFTVHFHIIKCKLSK